MIRAALSQLAIFSVLVGCGGAETAGERTAAIAAIEVSASEPRARASFLSGTPRPSTALSSLDTNALFDWAEKTYPDLFPGRSATLRAAPYDYRHYPATGNYVGVAGEDVFILGPISNQQIHKVGVRNEYRCQAEPASCGGPGYARAGWSTRLSSLQHGVSGTVTIVDARTLRISDFSYDGLGPQVLVYLGTEDSQAAFSIGPAIGSMLDRRRYVKETFEVQLPVGHSLDNFKAVSIWCVAFNANFGSGAFASGTSAAPPAAGRETGG